MDWDTVDWPALERLRDLFLGRTAAPGPYWADAHGLESYDYTFGRRIAWKWAAVLEPLFTRGWNPPARQLVDWGCGTGIGARSLLAHAGATAFDEVILWDHSPGATQFATSALTRRFPQLPVRVADPLATAQDGGFVLVASHVLNELDAPGRAALVELARKAAAVLWVEPGTFTDSRGLIEIREQLRDGFHCLAPCPHDGVCGMLATENAHHWCHHFAAPPTEVFTERGWAIFAQRLGIDLRSLPYSHLVLDRCAPERVEDLTRLIGRPRESPGLMRLLRCRADGVEDVELQKRVVPALWRTLHKERHTGLFVWKENSGRITGGAPAA